MLLLCGLNFIRKVNRSAITINIVSPDLIPIPISEGASTFLLELLKQHDIEFIPEHRVTALNDEMKLAEIDGHYSIKYDLFIEVPVHRPPKVILNSVLGKNGWVTVEMKTLRTMFDNVYALGDVTHIKAGSIMRKMK